MSDRLSQRDHAALVRLADGALAGNRRRRAQARVRELPDSERLLTRQRRVARALSAGEQLPPLHPTGFASRSRPALQLVAAGALPPSSPSCSCSDCRAPARRPSARPRSRSCPPRAQRPTPPARCCKRQPTVSGSPIGVRGSAGTQRKCAAMRSTAAEPPRSSMSTWATGSATRSSPARRFGDRPERGRQAQRPRHLRVSRPASRRPRRRRIRARRAHVRHRGPRHSPVRLLGSLPGRAMGRSASSGWRRRPRRPAFSERDTASASSRLQADGAAA